MIPFSTPKSKLSDFYTLSETKLFENHILHSGTYPYSLYMTVPPTPPFARESFWSAIRREYMDDVTYVNVFPSPPSLPPPPLPLLPHKKKNNKHQTTIPFVHLNTCTELTSFVSLGLEHTSLERLWYSDP